jgi:hypothetical protein
VALSDLLFMDFIKNMRKLLLALAIALSSPVVFTACVTPQIVAPQTHGQSVLVARAALTSLLNFATGLAERGLLTKDEFGNVLARAREIAAAIDLFALTGSQDQMKTIQEMLLNLEKDLKAKQ